MFGRKLPNEEKKTRITHPGLFLFSKFTFLKKVLTSGGGMLYLQKKEKLDMSIFDRLEKKWILKVSKQRAMKMKMKMDLKSVKFDNDYRLYVAIVEAVAENFVKLSGTEPTKFQTRLEKWTLADILGNKRNVIIRGPIIAREKAEEMAENTLIVCKNESFGDGRTVGELSEFERAELRKKLVDEMMRKGVTYNDTKIDGDELKKMIRKEVFKQMIGKSNNIFFGLTYDDLDSDSLEKKVVDKLMGNRKELKTKYFTFDRDSMTNIVVSDSSKRPECWVVKEGMKVVEVVRAEIVENDKELSLGIGWKLENEKESESEFTKDQ